ncbi:hypothetical protein LUZ60_017244 [Juncus effusus]|nr:hypothetical protein LUZ60_017244 [Juncus effusus]
MKGFKLLFYVRHNSITPYSDMFLMYKCKCKTLLKFQHLNKPSQSPQLKRDLKTTNPIPLQLHFKPRSLTFSSVRSNFESPPPASEMNGGRRLGMAAVALLAVAAAVLAVAPADAAKAERKFVRSTVKAHEIVIFSKSYCPYCRKAKGVFKELNKEAHVVELDQREDGSEIQDALFEIVGKRTVPQVFINGKHLGGSDDTVSAYESGKLNELLNISSSKEEDL